MALKNKSKKTPADKKAETVAVVGLGYVGLPLALAFSKKVPVIGFDINSKRIAMMKKGIDPSGELAKEDFTGSDIKFTDSEEDLKKATFFIVAVPTPVSDANEPNLDPLLGATAIVANALKKGDCVVYESTVYPGCTEEDCVPLLERISGLQFKRDFKVGYSPERINPGDKVHTLENTVKIVSGCDAKTLDRVAAAYSQVVEAGVHKAPSIKVAEAAKIIENTQRDVNIALMNELSVIFGRMGINTYDVIEAAGTKWNFLKFYPGLVGGHCIGVDPYYLVHKAHQLQYHPKVINAGRFVNDSMGGYIGKKIVKELSSEGISSKDAKVLVMGITFKENVSDIRNSKVVNIIDELKAYGVSVDVFDPHAEASAVKNEYGIELLPNPEAGSIIASIKKAVKERYGKKPDYDAVVVSVAHAENRELKEKDILEISHSGALLVDVKGLYRGETSLLNYWSL